MSAAGNRPGTRAPVRFAVSHLDRRLVEHAVIECFQANANTLAVGHFVSFWSRIAATKFLRHLLKVRRLQSSNSSDLWKANESRGVTNNSANGTSACTMVRFPRDSMLFTWPRRRFKSPIISALIFFRGDVFHLHDRLKQDRFARSEAIFHREDRRHFECELARVDFMEASEHDVAFNIDYW